MSRLVASAMLSLAICLPAAAANGDVTTGLWANSKAACKAAKQGHPEITSSVAAMASNQVSWEEAVCKFGALSSIGGKAVRPLACNGGNGAALWTGSMRIISRTTVVFSGGNTTQGTFKFCK